MKKRTMTWEKRIERAERDKGFTEADEKLAQSFCSCAVGEAFELEKEWKSGMWTMKGLLVLRHRVEGEETLDDLGMKFWVAVRENDVEKAKAVWERIQAAKAEL